MRFHTETGGPVETARRHDPGVVSARAAYEGSPLPTVLVDRDIRLVGANRAGRALFEGLDLFQRPLAGLFDHPGPVIIDDAVRRVVHGEGSVTVPVRWTGMDGAKRDGRLVMGALGRTDCRATIVAVVEVDRDATQAERDAAALREELVACAGHEIRNAFFVVAGHAEHLRRRGAEMTPEDVEAVGEHLLALVRRSEVLLADFIEARRPDGADAQPVDLVDALEGAFAMFAPDDSLLAIPEGVKVLAAPGRIEQIVCNLVRNARHHAGEGATVTVTVTADERSVAVAVSDDGPGVPEWAVPRIFDPFFRADRGGVAGSGLGLAVVKRLVETFGGAIRYERNEPRGARFLVTLQRADA